MPGTVAQEKPIDGFGSSEKEEKHPLSPDGKVTMLRDEQFQTVAFLAKSLSDENRLRILLYVSSGKKPVSRIVEDLNLSQPLVPIT